MMKFVGRSLFAVLVLLLLPVGTGARADLLGHGGMVRALDISPDGRRIVTGSFDFSAILWDFEEQRELAVLDGHEGPVTSVRFLPDGRVLSTGDDRRALIWDISGSEPRIVHELNGHTHKVMAGAVSGDGKIAVTGGWDKTVRIWNTSSGNAIRSIALPVPVNAVALIRNDATIAVGGHDSAIRLFDVRTGRAQGKLVGHKMGITELRASPNGRQLLSASIDKTLRLWDAYSHQPIRVLERHDSQVYGVRFTPDGRTAISGGRDGFIMIWDLATGKLLKSIKAHESIIWAVAVSPDGRFAISGSSDDTARVWHLATGDRIGVVTETEDEPKPWLESDHPGADLYKKCARCHALSPGGPRRSGPHFQGLFGRRVGTVPGYRYSDALKDQGFEWNQVTLFKLFDEGPDKFLPGTKMPVQRVSDRRKLSDLVDFLQQLTDPKKNAN